MTLSASPNPYRPGNGLEPPYLAGRGAELHAMRSLVGEFGTFPRNIALYGLRGVGKTCMLREYRVAALEAGWVPVRRALGPWVFDETTFAITLLSDLQDALEDLSAIEHLKSSAARVLSAARGFVGELRLQYQELELSLQAGGTRRRRELLDDDFRHALERVGRAAEARGRGVMILYDEFQELRDNRSQKQYPLGAFISALAAVQQDGLPVMLVACGLPPLIEHLAQAQSYTERMFEGQEIGALELEEAIRALEQPLENSGRRYGEGVVEAVVERTGRYPYFIQHYGRMLWDAADGAVIDTATFATIRGPARRKLDDYFFRARYLRATEAERDVMRHIADVGERARIRELLERTGRRNNSLQMLVRGLVDKGLVYRPTRGEVAFSAPMFGDYIRRKAYAA